MNETTAPQFRITPVVECPSCGAWTELAADARVLRCEACGSNAPIADAEPLAMAIAA
jgi:tRNA(Ile2) C34 agmatinyltransferase TiaS